MNHRYDKRSSVAIGATIIGADRPRDARHCPGVLSSDQLLAELKRLKDEGATSNAALARLLSLPTSRIAEIFNGTRQVRIDEMKALVEHFGLDEAEPRSAPNAETLSPLLAAILPLAPSGRLTDQSLRAVAEALSYGLELLGDRHATAASEDAIAVAARGAIARFRETAS